MPKPELKFIDLFSGIGGFHLGIIQAAKKLGVKAICDIAVDIDEKARETYGRYFPDVRLGKDVRDPAVQKSICKNAGIICAGFPCQPFSQAGRMKGFEDARGTLFFEIDSILEVKKPRAVFLENVRNLVSHDEGYTLGRILQQLEKRGYDILVPKEAELLGLSDRDRVKKYVQVNEGKRWSILKASNYLSPTHRPRVYIVAFNRNKVSVAARKQFQFPIPTGKKTLEDVLGKPWPNIVGKTLRVGGRSSPHGNRHNWDSYNGTDKSIKIIGPAEGLKIMGFPQDYFPEKLSTTQRMKQLGNSVAIPVIQAVASEIIKVLRL